MNELKFTKMHGLGNDFMVIDGVNYPEVAQVIRTSKTLLQNLSDRHRGVGFDQCLLIEKGNSPIDFFYSIFNADGSEVGQCGNGARCVARFIHEEGLSAKKKYRLATKTTELTVEIHDKNYQKITVELGVARFLSTCLEPLLANECLSQRKRMPRRGQVRENLGILKDSEYTFCAIDLGNPHAVIRVNDIDSASVEKIGQQLNTSPFHPLFPTGVNVGFMEIKNNQQLNLRVFERGAGETQACGSGACAAMICARKFYDTDSTMCVTLPGGTLEITWSGDGFPVSMTGDAVRVFDGVLKKLKKA